MYNDENNLNGNEYNSANNMTQNNEQDGGSQYRYSGNNIPYNQTSQQSSNTGYTQQNYNNSYDNAQNGNANYYNNMNNNNANNGYGYNNQGYNAQGNMTGNIPPKKKKGNSGEGFKKFFKNKNVKRVGASLLCGVVAGAVMLGTFYAGVNVLGIGSSKSNYEISTVSTAVPSSAVVSDNSVDIAGVSMDVSSAATSGTGIIVGKNDTELLILTNNHVIEDVNDLQCVFADNQSVSATVKGSKSDKDIAVVAVNLSDISEDTLSKIAIAELGDSDDIKVGQQVVAIGNALGEGQSVTTGIISALDKSITVNNITFSGLFMTDAAINSGNSGGALLDASGKVIGINFAKTSEDGVEGMAYSIPVSNVRELIDSLMNRETRTKVNTSEASYLGISAMDITSSMASQYGYPQGILIRQVVSGSAAEKAGLGAYDIIVSFDDQSITSFAGLQSTMQYYKAGETVTIEYYHLEGNQYVLKSTQVTLDKKNE